MKVTLTLAGHNGSHDVRVTGNFANSWRDRFQLHWVSGDYPSLLTRKHTGTAAEQMGC